MNIKDCLIDENGELYTHDGYKLNDEAIAGYRLPLSRLECASPECRKVKLTYFNKQGNAIGRNVFVTSYFDKSQLKARLRSLKVTADTEARINPLVTHVLVECDDNLYNVRMACL